jgi:photosystem II stability/assembly factor-like uncharacterized protein
MKKLFLALVMLIAMNASGQWVQMSNGMGTNNRVWTLASDGTNIYAGKDSNGVYISTNNGASWTQTALNNQYVFCLATRGNFVFAGTVNSVYVSTNYGANWINRALMNNASVRSLATLGNNIFAGTTYYGIFVSTNNGTNWTQTVLNNKPVYSLATIGNNIFAGTSSNGVYLSNDTGKTWTQTSLESKLISALAVSGNNIYAGIGDYQLGIYVSSNNGTNWSQTSLNNISNNYVFVGTELLSVWRRPLSEIIGIQNISTEVPSKYSLSQNYPNPFNPMCNVQFSMYKAGQVKLVVYDVQGREVQTLVNEKLSAGTYEVKFDGSYAKQWSVFL